jgi:hypothetical protein
MNLFISLLPLPLTGVLKDITKIPISLGISRIGYMRKDLLDKFLREKAMDLVWGVWGERRFKSRNNVGLDEFAKKHKSYKVFQTVITYRNIIT